ncbi:hypothetical protein ACFRAO_31735 [Streptomyces sp. NPDC056656]|uniref:hypothetical protein n=1 Tax=Streptomyces sp. NPDC056656 TaxID=3345895 RepID=UPI0036C031D5
MSHTSPAGRGTHDKGPRTGLYGGAGLPRVGAAPDAVEHVGRRPEGSLSNGMSLIGLASYDEQIVTGALVFAAASVEGLLHRLRSRRGPDTR